MSTFAAYAPALMFPALFALVFMGVPVAAALIGVAFAFGYWASGDLIGLQLFRFTWSVTSNYILVAIPLFVFMGSMLERSGIAEKLFEAMRVWLGRFRGGLALATITMCAIFAAGTGIVGAVEVLVGLMAMPAMLKYRYHPALISGTICAGGSLGTMIPPSIVVVIYAAQARIPIGDLLVGVLVPGGIMVALFLGYIVLHTQVRPQDGPPVPPEEIDMTTAEKLKLLATALVPATLLILSVVGSITAGIASPTEAAGVGALGTILLTMFYGRFTLKLLFDALRTTLTINAMIMMIVLGGTMFTSIFLTTGGARMVNGLVDMWSLGAAGVTALYLVLIFLGGFILDWVSIVLVTAPIFEPLLNKFGVDKLWVGVMAVVVIQTSYLTPPMAPSIFYLRGIAPPEVTYRDMYLGIIPFVACQLLTLLAVLAMPWTATWLPTVTRAF
jgi:tripartite ATP-independent transporter DctM subunit